MSSPSLARFLSEQRLDKVKLHLGCGGVRWKDFINVDLYPATDRPDTSRQGCIADVFADIRALGLDDAMVDEIFTSHTLEHFPRWETLDLLRDWHRMLKPGGKLVIEMPDFQRCVLWLFHPSARKRSLARSQFYGNQWDRLDYETHRYVWSAGELRRELFTIGFSRVSVNHSPETHFAGRDMRVEATR